MTKEEEVKEEEDDASLDTVLNVNDISIDPEQEGAGEIGSGQGV